MEERSLQLKEILVHLADTGKPLKNTELSELSDLGRGEAAAFVKMWGALPLKRRRDIVHRLVELSENNVELDFEIMFRSLLRDDDAEIRHTAIEGLWESEDASLFTPLIRLLNNDPSPEVQAAAAKALGKFAVLAEHKKMRPGYPELLGRTLLDIVRNETRPIEVRRRALEAVAPLSLPDVAKAITTAYQSKDVKFKISAVYAMGRSCNASFMTILKRELQSSDSEFRYEAAVAMGEMGEEEAVPYLLELLEDPDFDVQMAVIRSFGEIGGTQVRRILRELLKSENEAVSEAAEEALEVLEGGENPLGFIK